MKKYSSNSIGIHRAGNRSKAGGALFLGIVFATAVSLITHAQTPSDPVVITSIAPLTPGGRDILIQWEGSVPPYKLQVQNSSVGRNWVDATFHIYGNSYVVSNSVEGAFYRVRTIPDRVPPPALPGFFLREVECDQVRLGWNLGACSDPWCADSPGGTGLRGIRIYRDGELLTEVRGGGSMVDIGVTPSSTYTYWATAIDKAGNESVPSDAVVVNTPSCAGEPGNTPTLVWNANPEPDIAGYIVRYGAESGAYSVSTNVGNVTETPLPNLISGTTYYFVVSAYNTAGLESDPSTEVSYTKP